jgi:cell division protein FtsW
MRKGININKYGFMKIDVEYYFLFVLTLVLSIIGLIMISSSSISVGEKYFNDPYWFIRRQVIWWVISFIFFIIASRINYRYYQKFSIYIMIVLVGLLALVLIPGIGVEVGGFRRALNLGFFSIQPSEFAKIALVIFFSDSLDKRYKDDKRIRNIIFPSFLVLCLIAILIFLEPDMSAMVVIGLVAFIILFAGGVRFKHLLGLGFIGALVTFGYMFLEDYRRERIFEFIERIIALFNGSEEIREASFQVSQSLIALGSGNIVGLGLGNSVQKYYYLPEAHTDFIFAIIGEELGLLGTILVVILFVLFMFFGIRVCFKTRDYFGKVMAVGLTSIIVVPAIINIFVVVGLAPVTGLALPFISYGGSSLLVSMISVGILLNISRQGTKPKKEDTED